MLAKRLLPILLFGGYALAIISLVWRKKLLLFLHPDFLILAYLAIFTLLFLTVWLLFTHKHHHHPVNLVWWRIVLLLLPLVTVFLFEMRPLSSSAALERGLSTGALTIGRSLNAHQFATKPEKRSLYQWVIALNANPEPSHYEGQAVHVSGFVVHDPSLPADQVNIARFIVTCCAADARVLSLPIQKTLPFFSELKDDEWIDVTGKMAVIETLGKRSLVILPTEVKRISQPDNPYEI